MALGANSGTVIGC